MTNKQVKVTSYYRGVKTRKISLNLTWYQRLYQWIWLQIKRAAMITTIALLVAMFAEGYRHINPVVISQAQAQEDTLTIPPILERIADCESGTRKSNGKAVKGSATQYGKSGQVLMTGNANKSVDVGKYAINSVWYKQASQLNFDLTEESGNAQMAMWIYQNRGTGDWSASESCWSK